MCTVSWLHTNEGYHLLCNRDERHTRKSAIAPFIQERRGVRFIAPIDGEHGGSWIALNQFGLTLCLLNRYCSLCPLPRSAVSRGLLLMELVDCNSLDSVSRRIMQLEMQHFYPFDVVALEPRKGSLLIHWTGRECLIEYNGESAMPLTSSSFDEAGVIAYRKSLFDKLTSEKGQIDCALLHDFHTSHAPAPSAYSPCMHREDASTVSFSQVRVAGSIIEFSYQPHSPCSPVASKTCLTYLRSNLMGSVPEGPPEIHFHVPTPGNLGQHGREQQRVRVTDQCDGG